MCNMHAWYHSETDLLPCLLSRLDVQKPQASLGSNDPVPVEEVEVGPGHGVFFDSATLYHRAVGSTSENLTPRLLVLVSPEDGYQPEFPVRDCKSIGTDEEGQQAGCEE